MLARLRDLLVEWGSGTPFASRLPNLRAGVGPSWASLRSAVNVRTDLGEDDQLSRGGELDWYFKAIDDVVVDLFAGEVSHAS